MELTGGLLFSSLVMTLSNCFNIGRNISANKQKSLHAYRFQQHSDRLIFVDGVTKDQSKIKE